jgi:hypothetical protein
MPDGQQLTVQDRFEIFEQLNKHQRAIDADPGRPAVDSYNALYWPEAKFHVFDLREATFEGPETEPGSALSGPRGWTPTGLQTCSSLTSASPTDASKPRESDREFRRLT